MSEEKGQAKVRRAFAEFIGDATGALTVGELLGFLLVPWAMATFFISDFLHIESMLFIVLIGILTAPILAAPAMFVAVILDEPRRGKRREQEAEAFYRSRMKKPLKREKL